MSTTPEFDPLAKRTPHQRIELIKRWSMWFYERTETFAGELSLELAYLWPAIATATVIEVKPNSALVQLLQEHKVPEHSEIWGYLDQIGDGDKSI